MSKSKNMNSCPLVSIIVPVYNVGKYLCECLDSCLAQTYKNIEVIVVNDGSTDDSGAMIEKYVVQDNRFKQLRQENQGLPRARSNGVNFSSGDYLLHLDGDDFLAINCVELMVKAAISNGADMVYSDVCRWTNEGVRTLVRINPKDIPANSGVEFLESNIPMFVCMKMYRREIFLNLIPQNCNVSEDYFFNLQALPRCKKIVYVKEYLYYYRMNPGSIMNSKMSNIAKQYLIHAFQRRELFSIIDYTDKVKNGLSFDNIRVIFRYFKFVGIDQEIMKLVDITFREYKFHFSANAKVLKMSIFLIFAKFSPKIALWMTHR